MIKLSTCLVLVGLVGRASAQPVAEPTPSPVAVPEAVPPPPERDPLAVTMTTQAHSAALRNDCDAVEKFAFRVRALDPDLYRDKFASDPIIIACDPRPARARDAMTEAPRDRYHETGFIFGLALAVGRAIDTSTIQPFSSQPPGFPLIPLTRGYFGYQGDKVSIGVQLQFGREAHTDSTLMMPVTTSATTILIGPALRAQLWQSRTARAELLLALDVGFGEAWTATDPDPDGTIDPSPADLHVAARAGFGARYWLAPSFALAVTSGLGVDYREINEPGAILDASGQSTNIVDSTSTTIDTTFEIVGVF